MSATTSAGILDVGGSTIHSYNRTLLEKKLFWTDVPFMTLGGHVQRVLPTSIIHGDEGLELWAKITQLPDYYQTRAEAALLMKNARELALRIQENSVLIDLGCGYVIFASDYLGSCGNY
jgi:hypothetical protein